jgi:hypothetical protein
VPGLVTRIVTGAVARTTGIRSSPRTGRTERDEPGCRADDGLSACDWMHEPDRQEPGEGGVARWIRGGYALRNHCSMSLLTKRRPSARGTKDRPSQGQAAGR